MTKTLTVQEFFEMFPSDDACLAHLMKQRYGDIIRCPLCKKDNKFHKVKNRPVYECSCGFQINPMVNTPFENSHTPLQKWFYAMYLFTTSRHGVPAKEIQRQLGVTYKTAWRIAHEIRKYMGKIDGDDKLYDHVEIDETLIGGRKRGRSGPNADDKTIVLGMVQRQGNVMTKIVPDIKIDTLHKIIVKNVMPRTTISTDQMRSYHSLKHRGFTHRMVDHSMQEYVRGNVHTNTIEGFWSLLKRSIKGTHVHVSKKHLQKYLGEFEFRYNMRSNPEGMFSRLVYGF